MPIPDISGPKVLPAVFIFAAYSLGLLKQQTVLVRMLVMTILLTVIYKFVLRLTYKPADIIVPSLLYGLFAPGQYFTMPGNSPESPAVIVSHTIVYAFAFASLRGVFPQFY
jgi:hypothetical protein